MMQIAWFYGFGDYQQGSLGITILIICHTALVHVYKYRILGCSLFIWGPWRIMD